MSRRREVRVVSAISVLDSETAVEYQSSDLSTSGLFVVGVTAWPVGSVRPLHIRYRNFDLPLEARVVRADDDGTAVAFVSPSMEDIDKIVRLMHTLLSEQDAPLSDQRHARRIKTNGALAWIYDATEYYSSLTEVSTHGAVVECRAPPARGARITIKLPGATEDAGDVFCTAGVVRLVNGGFAVSFDHPSKEFRAALSKIHAGVARG